MSSVGSSIDMSDPVDDLTAGSSTTGLHELIRSGLLWHSEMNFVHASLHEYPTNYSEERNFQNIYTSIFILITFLSILLFLCIKSIYFIIISFKKRKEKEKKGERSRTNANWNLKNFGKGLHNCRTCWIDKVTMRCTFYFLPFLSFYYYYYYLKSNLNGVRNYFVHWVTTRPHLTKSN